MPRPKKVGSRRRFSGFWLTDAERDRVVAGWIEQQPNAAESIKALIYAAAVGYAVPPRPPAAAGDQSDEPGPIDAADPNAKKLFSFET